jgi:hypothetical protein
MLDLVVQYRLGPYFRKQTLVSRGTSAATYTAALPLLLGD